MSNDQKVSRKGAKDAKKARQELLGFALRPLRLCEKLFDPPLSGKYLLIQLLITTLCLTFGLNPLQAALDPEGDKPYRLQVVLRIAPHRLLTPVFQDRLRRELRDSLQADLGALGQVEVLDQHPLLKEIEANGLQQALDGWKKLSDSKTHFVLLDFVEGQCEIQAAQHDGWTGLAGPVVRRVRIADRELVARTAALLIQRDFGLAGTVIDPTSDPDTVQIALKGGKLGVSLDRWLKKDEVFALAQVSRGSSGLQSFRVPEALLQVKEEPRAGICVCRLIHRYAKPLAGGPAVLGYRCLKLGTTRAPLRLRLVDSQGMPHDGLQVQVSPYGFRNQDVKEEGATRSEGFFQTKQSYAHMAFVRVFSGATSLAQIPIEILDDRTVVCRVHIAPGADLLGQLDVRKNRWVRRLYESLQVQADLRKELNDLIGKSLHEAARDRAQTGLQGLQAGLETLKDELSSLRTAAKELPPRIHFNLTEGEQRLGDVQKQRDELQGFLRNLEEIIKQKNDPKRQELLAKVAQARLLESQADFAGAIELYETVLKESDQPQLRKNLDELKKAWTPKDPKHQEARAFVYQIWPKLDSAPKMKVHLEEARKAFVTCRDAGDWRTLQKLVLANVAHVTKLKERLDALRPQESEDDRKENEAIVEVADDLAKLHKEASDYVQRQQPPEAPATPKK